MAAYGRAIRPYRRRSGDWPSIESASESRVIQKLVSVALGCATILYRATNPNSFRRASNSEGEFQPNTCEFFRSSGGFAGRLSDHPPHPKRGSRGRLCSQARQTSEIVPARPPMTIQASPARAISKFRASPMPQGMTTVAGHSADGISSGGMMLTTRPPACSARSAATRVAGLPQPLTSVIPRRARSAPASAAISYASEPGSALPNTLTCGLLFISQSYLLKGLRPDSW